MVFDDTAITQMDTYTHTRGREIPSSRAWRNKSASAFPKVGATALQVGRKALVGRPYDLISTVPTYKVIKSSY